MSKWKKDEKRTKLYSIKHTKWRSQNFDSRGAEERLKFSFEKVVFILIVFCVLDFSYNTHADYFGSICNYVCEVVLFFLQVTKYKYLLLIYESNSQNFISRCKFI